VLKNYHPVVMLKKYHLVIIWKKLYTYISYNFLKIESGGERSFPEKETWVLVTLLVPSTISRARTRSCRTFGFVVSIVFFFFFFFFFFAPGLGTEAFFCEMNNHMHLDRTTMLGQQDHHAEHHCVGTWHVSSSVST